MPKYIKARSGPKNSVIYTDMELLIDTILKSMVGYQRMRALL